MGVLGGGEVEKGSTGRRGGSKRKYWGGGEVVKGSTGRRGGREGKYWEEGR